MAKPNGDNLSAERRKAFDALNIPYDHRLILCLDGGGMRGILTIQLLKQLEAVAGIPCHKLFDMVSGTSTGAIITGLIATGHDAETIEGLYENLVTEVFDERFLGNRFLNPPAFSKKKYREILKEKIFDVTLEQACATHNIDMMITSQDLAAAEETFFSCFKQEYDESSFYGTYKSVLLRAVMESTMSAPTYFYPLERFVDGGTTTYNNPSLAAFIEATSYSTPKDKRATSANRAYHHGKLTLFSFGTGISRQFLQPMEAMNPKGIDIAFWLDWIMTATGQDASAMQSDTFRSPVMKEWVDFRRFQISIDPQAIGKLPNTDGLDAKKYGTSWLWDVKEDVLKKIDMADVTKFDLMKIIGTQMAKYIMQKGDAFTRDLINDRGRDALVSAFGDVERICKQMSNPEWLDNFQA
jgi:hypothetical protein